MDVAWRHDAEVFGALLTCQSSIFYSCVDVDAATLSWQSNDERLDENCHHISAMRRRADVVGDAPNQQIPE